MIFAIAFGAFAATFLGGMFAIRFKDKLHLILGFSAGALLGVAFFDLLPEAIEIGGGYWNLNTTMLAIAGGFVAYLLLDRLLFMQCHEEGHDHSLVGHHDSHDGSPFGSRRGIFGAGALSFHSFLDGVAIGLAFHVSSAVGAIVTAAVLTHDFSDGINTVSMILRHGGARREAIKWLAIDALAPVLGVLSTFAFSISESWLSIVLAVFCGFFLYIGASDLLPESHHSHPTRWTTFATIIGMAVVYGAVTLAGL